MKRFINSKATQFALVSMFFILAVIFHCYGVQAEASSTPAFTGDVTWKVDAEVEATLLSCEVKPYKGWKKSVCHFELNIKNKADRSLRFRVRIMLSEEGLGCGGFVPRKTKLKPGEEMKVVYPVRYEKIPEAIVITVNTVE